MNRSTIDLWVGIFVALGIAGILFLALKVGNLVAFGSTPGYRLEAAFDNIGGLKVGAAVTMAGVRIGRVTDIRIDPKNFEADVAMTISRGYSNIPDDSDASVLTARSSDSGLVSPGSGQTWTRRRCGGSPEGAARVT